MSPLIWGILLGVVFIIFLVMLIVAAIRAPEASDPIEDRLAEFGVRDDPLTLEELELSQSFYDRIVLPLFNQIGKLASKFTPQATLESAKQRLEMAGNPMRMEPAFFLSLRFILSLGLGGLIALVLVLGGRSLTMAMGLTGLFSLLGFLAPNLWISGRIRSRQQGIFRAMPDALDLLTICVEAGLGFDAAMSKVHAKWDNDLSNEFGRVIQEIRLGKLRREALRDMADRLGVAELTSFVAAVIQSEQLGVSMAKVLRIQSDQMRVRRRQMAEEEAHKAPIKMVFPIGLLIFPSILIILLGPAGMMLIQSPMGSMFR